ncbi:hypothetical protein IMG5_017790 [Ichthyophthirius multifiliis]|uniref:Cyclin-dependent kinase 2 homolog n=1 Tax=Ichthyophthirius multifiliis TaxID=5932 RepID=G0QKH3_ICHMU|nr:hypothetical protein IMG5_017790 [Ichthyophthirius multifiliis]EGR34283.1 hypothetical protein IMG5_017790 [Ichthyophthirius multifiliis]|eukprot:XP_004039587.1 hypothetical protein IMG5_017790 [Ichthyophthirius multifiliis]
MSNKNLEKTKKQSKEINENSSDSNFESDCNLEKNEINQNLDEEERISLRKHSYELSAEKKLQLLKKRKICGLLEGCDSVDNYQKLNKIHEGVYGVVYRAIDKLTGEIIAIKKTKIDRTREKDGFPITSIREFNILMALRHENIIAVKRVVVGSDCDMIYMIMEYMEHELKDLIENQNFDFTESEIKNLDNQKQCDFGLGRKYQGLNKPYTLNVVTMWYRAPEILLGQDRYSTALDMWSVGCIFGELVIRDQLFKGTCEINQIEKIFNAVGGPNIKDWKNWVNLKQAKFFEKKEYPQDSSGLKDIIGNKISQQGFKLLCDMLCLNPDKRITASKALQDKWFKEEPLPAKNEDMPKFKALNEVSREERKKSKNNYQQNQQ